MQQDGRTPRGAAGRAAAGAGIGRRGALGLAAALLPLPALAQRFPERAVTVVVPFGPGGPNDIVARLGAEGAGRIWGTPLVVENRPGGGGNIGIVAALQRPADGHTLIFSGPTIVVNRWITARPGFDPDRDIVPVAKVARMPLVLLVNPNLPVRSAADFIALARQRPGRLNIASSGVGTVPHLSAEIFRARAGIDFVHVPYRSDPMATQAVATGEADAFFGIPASLPLARAGTIRAVGVTTATRFAGAPEIPAIAESGLPGFEVEAWYGVFAAAATPPAIVAQAAAAWMDGLRQPDLAQRLQDAGIEPSFEGPAGFAAFIRAESAKWGEAVRAAGIRPE